MRKIIRRIMQRNYYFSLLLARTGSESELVARQPAPGKAGARRDVSLSRTWPMIRGSTRTRWKNLLLLARRSRRRRRQHTYTPGTSLLGRRACTWPSVCGVFCGTHTHTSTADAAAISFSYSPIPTLTPTLTRGYPLRHNTTYFHPRARNRS